MHLLPSLLLFLSFLAQGLLAQRQSQLRGRQLWRGGGGGGGAHLGSGGMIPSRRTDSPSAQPSPLPSAQPSLQPSVSNMPSLSPSETAMPSGTPSFTSMPSESSVPSDMPSRIISEIEARIRPWVWRGRTDLLEDGTAYQHCALRRTEAQAGIETASVAKTLQYYALHCIHCATYAQANVVTQHDPTVQEWGGQLPGWIRQDGWTDPTVDPCECGGASICQDVWYGVTCEADRITQLELAGNRLIGTWPPEVVLLGVDGDYGEVAAGNLEVLDVSENFFLFNDFDFSWLAYLGSNLKYLYFAETSFAGRLQPLPHNLVELDASYSLISQGIPDNLFPSAPNLNYVALDGAFFNSSVPANVATLQNLEYFYVSDCFLSGTLDYMQGMTSLVETWVDYNVGLGGSLSTHLGDLVNLEVLSAADCSISGPIPTEVGTMTALVEVYLYGNLLTGGIPVEVGDLPNLEVFQVEDNDLVGDMPQEVCDITATNGGTLEILGADCRSGQPEVPCTCCTCCSRRQCED